MVKFGKVIHLLKANDADLLLQSHSQLYLQFVDEPSRDQDPQCFGFRHYHQSDIEYANEVDEVNEEIYLIFGVRLEELRASYQDLCKEKSVYVVASEFYGRNGIVVDGFMFFFEFVKMDDWGEKEEMLLYAFVELPVVDYSDQHY